MKVLFLFLDGVGLGEDDPDSNPFAGTAMPNLEGMLGGHKLVSDGYRHAAGSISVNTHIATLLAVDATMGIEGMPQSASGQAALLTGKNVPAWLGEHEGPKPTMPIIELLTKGTLLTQLQQQSRTADLVNAYPPRYFESIERGYHLPGVIALAAQQAGMRLHTRADLSEGKAVSADFTGEGWHNYLGYPDMPVLSYAQAGERLIRLADQSDLSIFEYWLTDVAGHHQDAQGARSILQSLDAVLGSLVDLGDGESRLILITSDHGNMEDLRTRHHTRNDVPLLLIGSQSVRDKFLEKLSLGQSCRAKPDLTDVGPAILKFIG